MYREHTPTYSSVLRWPLVNRSIGDSPKRVTVCWLDNYLEVSCMRRNPVPDEIYRLIQEIASYVQYNYLHANQSAICHLGGWGHPNAFVRRVLYTVDNYGRILLPAGLLWRLVDNIISIGYGVDFYAVPRHHSDVYNVDWDNVKKRIEFRAHQEECLKSIQDHACGIIHAPTGFGKSLLIAAVCCLFPKAQIDIVTRRVEVARMIARRVHHITQEYVGMVGGGSRSRSRITVYTAASLSHSDATAHILLADEAHELSSEQSSYYLKAYKHSRNYGFSASPYGRSDNSDLRTEALFGPTIFRMSYDDAVTSGSVAPIRVLWYPVLACEPSLMSWYSRVEDRYYIWRNKYRNRLIATVVRSLGRAKILILVKTIEHALALRQELPEATVIYDSITPKSYKYFLREKLLDPNETLLSDKDLERIRNEFMSGSIHCVIATPVWSTGIDLPKLQYLIRADATSSYIFSVQSSGRVSRLDASKLSGIVVDFMDKFHDRYYRRSLRRRSHYRSMGWHQEEMECPIFNSKTPPTISPYQ